MTCRSSLSLCSSLLFFACGGAQPSPEPAPVAPVTKPAPEAEPEAKPEAKPEPKVEAPKPVLRWTDGLSTPESVLHDTANDRYLVSNIAGKPLDVDGNGFISVLSPDGKLIKDKWIAGGEAKVKLDAPKGMGIAGGVLYVADITVVRKFDLKTGAPKGEIAIAGSTFLNDVAVGSDGRVYVSDTGMKQGEKDFEPSGADAVYVIDKAGKVKPLAKSADLGRPNGLWISDKGPLVVTFGSNELYRLDDKGEKQDVTKLPEGGLDGVVPLGDALLVSSWKASAVYKVKLGGAVSVALTGLKAPADIGYDEKRKRVLVPRFMENAVEAYALE